MLNNVASEVPCFAAGTLGTSSIPAAASPCTSTTLYGWLRLNLSCTPPMDLRTPFASFYKLWKSPKDVKPELRAQLDDAAVTSLLVALGLVVCGWLFWRNARARFNNLPQRRKRSVAVLVLGDVGRSPRMMYHAESFAKHGFETFIVGYEGSYHRYTRMITVLTVHTNTRSGSHCCFETRASC